MKQELDDPFEQIRQAGSSAPNYDMGNEEIISRMKEWTSKCQFRITAAGYDSVDVVFETLPEDMDAFARELYEFCPDLVDQGTGCVGEMLEVVDEVPENLVDLIEGLDLDDPDSGVEILKRSVIRDKAIKFWWD